MLMCARSSLASRDKLQYKLQKIYMCFQCNDEMNPGCCAYLGRHMPASHCPLHVLLKTLYRLATKRPWQGSCYEIDNNWFGSERQFIILEDCFLLSYWQHLIIKSPLILNNDLTPNSLQVISCTMMTMFTRCERIKQLTDYLVDLKCRKPPRASFL